MCNLFCCRLYQSYSGKIYLLMLRVALTPRDPSNWICPHPLFSLSLLFSRGMVTSSSVHLHLTPVKIDKTVKLRTQTNSALVYMCASVVATAHHLMLHSTLGLWPFFINIRGEEYRWRTEASTWSKARVFLFVWFFFWELGERGDLGGMGEDETINPLRRN